MRYVVLALALVLAGGFATAAWAQEDDSGARYRLATAVVGDVQQSLSLSGTVEHANRSDASFAGNGTLAKVYVEEGEHVKAGQRLAALETAALEAAITEAEARLAQAKAQLEADQDAQEEAQEEAGEEKEKEAAPQQEQPQQPSKKLAKQQAAVREAQTKSFEALAAAKAALAAQQQACQAAGEDCTAALAAVQRAQDEVAAAQEKLQQAIAKLAAAMGQGQPESVMVPAVALDQPSTPTAGTIAEDQAAIDQAEADLLSAEKELAAAVLRAPRAGTVESVPVKAGDEVEAGSTIATVIGKGATTVRTSATVEQVKKLAVGQPVVVTVPGVEPLSGTVSDIALLPASGTDETTYPVTVTLTGGADLPTGSTASAAVVVATASGVVTVPASAVEDGSVQVMRKGKPAEQKVTVGAVGATTIEVSGIKAGTRVVLADRDAELPSQQNQGPGGLGGLGGGPRQEFRGPAGGPSVVRIP